MDDFRRGAPVAYTHSFSSYSIYRTQATMSDSSRETRTSNAGANIKTFRNGDMPQDGLRNEQMKGTVENKTAGNDALGEAGGVLPVGTISDKAKGAFGAGAGDKP